MKDQKLRQLLSILPEEPDLGTRAARARGRALSRLDHSQPAPRRWLWVPAMALAVVLGIGAMWISRIWTVQPLVLQPAVPVIAQVPLTLPAPAPPPRKAAPPLKQDRLQVQWVLSDGTRVLWTFDKDFSL